MMAPSASSQNRRWILSAGLGVWLLFAMAFFLPVSKNHNFVGWEAAWFYLYETANPIETWNHIKDRPVEALALTFSWTNFTMLAAPLVLWRWPRWCGALGVLLALGGAVPLWCFHPEMRRDELNAGFYCWVASIFLMALVSGQNWWRFRRAQRSQRLDAD